MPSFADRLKDYELVEDRLGRFWADYPNGRVHTELVNGSVLGESAVFVASIYKDKADLYPDATGHAQETPGSTPVNKTSWIENCETSAIGRALANMGYAPKGHRPSREEMAKVEKPLAGRAAKPAAKRWRPRPAQVELLDAFKDADIDDPLRHRISLMLTGHASVKDMTDEDCGKVVKQLAWFQVNRAAGMQELERWEKAQGLA